MSPEQFSDVRFEIGHVLFIDIVGYSKLLITEQSELLQTLKQIVRGTEQFRLIRGTKEEVGSRLVITYVCPGHVEKQNNVETKPKTKPTTKNQIERNMKTIKSLILLLSMTSFVVAGEKMSDAQIKQKLIGYWTFGHHGWHIAADGIAYICPGTEKNTWSVKDGMFYWADNVPHTILTLTDKKFVYREPASSTGTATLIRGTKEQFEPCGGSQ